MRVYLSGQRVGKAHYDVDYGIYIDTIRVLYAKGGYNLDNVYTENELYNLISDSIVYELNVNKYGGKNGGIEIEFHNLGVMLNIFTYMGFKIDHVNENYVLMYQDILLKDDKKTDQKIVL